MRPALCGLKGYEHEIYDNYYNVAGHPLPLPKGDISRKRVACGHEASTMRLEKL